MVVSNNKLSEPSVDTPQSAQQGKSGRWWLGRLIGPASFLCAGVLTIVLLGVAQRVGWISSQGGAVGSGKSLEEIHTCPMHPQIRQPGPGRCPVCGMALVPATSGGEDANSLSVKIEPAHRRLSNIQTTPAKREAVAATIRTIGAVRIDESRMATIASYVDGRLERLFADYTGVDVAKQDHLAVVYSPELFSAQVEYLETRKGLSGENTLPVIRKAQQNLLANSRQKLAELGMQETQIAELEKAGKAASRITVYAPIGGTVIEKICRRRKVHQGGRSDLSHC